MGNNEFRIDEFLGLSNKKTTENINEKEVARRFEQVCDIVKAALDKQWETSDDKEKEKRLVEEKRAIIGYQKETEMFKEQIRNILRAKDIAAESFPSYYPSLEEAVFSELFGLSGLTPWAYDMTPEYAESSSAKLIGERLYCLINGKSQLQPQRIPKKRREQLKRSLLLGTPKERLEDGFHEVYLHNGIRITIFSGERTKEDQDIIVFRKYVLKDLSFEKMVELGTIPPEASELFKLMIKCGYNTVMAGQVRSGKTTFLQTWQSYEDQSLEGLAIATDPETPWDKIMPDAPIMQLVVDDKQQDDLTKSLLRGDQDYILLEEMRNASAFRTFLSITSTGTQRSKGTIHDNNAINIPYKMASEITAKYGGDQNALIAQCYTNINYVLEFYQVPENKAKKKLKGIVEFRYDFEKDIVSAHRICQYDPVHDTWMWKCDIGKDKERIAIGFEKEFARMREILYMLEAKSPLRGTTVIFPAYYHSQNNMRKED